MSTQLSTPNSAIELALPPLPPAPLTEHLAQSAVTPASRSTLSCAALLTGDTRVRAEAEAAALLEELITNTQVVNTFGRGAMEGVNALATRLLRDVRPADIPELKEIMHGLNDGMRGIRRKYNVADPEIRERYENFKGGLGRLFGRARSFLEMFMEDITSFERQLDKVVEDLSGRKQEMVVNMGYYDELYRLNEEEIRKLLYVIGVMELTEQLAAQRAQSIVVKDPLHDHELSEQQAAMAQLAQMLGVKVGDYKSRLFIAWATSPQVRMMRMIDYGLAQKLDTLIDVTIPTMKLTIAQWRMLMQAIEAGQAIQVVDASFNETVQGFFVAAGKAVPEIAKIIEDPIMAAETINVMAASIQAQADGIIVAMDFGAERRAENDQAALAALDVMTDASQRVSDALVDRVIGQVTKPVELPATTVPAS